MVRNYLRAFGALFIAIGALTIFAPTGGLMLLLGVALLIQAGLISLSLRAYAKAAELTRHVVAQVRVERVPEVAAIERSGASTPSSMRPVLHA